MNIDANTKLFGIIGYPLKHSFSPAMHNAAFKATGYNGVYLAFEQKNLLQLKHTLNQFHVQGLSVTIPHKQKVRRLVDHLDPLALQIGSLNTLLRTQKGLWAGYNTDGIGAVKAIEESGFTIEGKKILIIGNGGSARAIAFALCANKPAQLGFLTRNQIPSQKIKQGLRLMKFCPPVELLQFANEKWKSKIVKHKYILQSPQQIEKYDLIIHATPAGMKHHPLEAASLLSSDFLFKHQTLFDIVYNLPVTPLMQLAKKKKMNVIQGYKMLLYQGVLQFELFTKTKAPEEVMEKALLQSMKEQGVG